jgi:hypothetical protein
MTLRTSPVGCRLPGRTEDPLHRETWRLGGPGSPGLLMSVTDLIHHADNLGRLDGSGRPTVAPRALLPERKVPQISLPRQGSDPTGAEIKNYKEKKGN